MQAIVVSNLGGPEVMQVGDVPVPEPGPEEILVRVLAAGVGPWDASLRRGGRSGSLPYIPGGEFAGVVEGDTGSFAGFDDGAPVYGYPALTGCYAQYVTCPVEQLAPIPVGLTAADAAAVPIDALTAEQGLTDVLTVGTGDRVLITAGAGGLGHFAVQIARLLGAWVVVTASPQHHEFVHKLGAASSITPGPTGPTRCATPSAAAPSAYWRAPSPRWPGRPARPAMAPRSRPPCTPTFLTASGSAGSPTTASRAAAA